MGNFWAVLIGKMRSLGHELVCCNPPGDPAFDARLEALGLRVEHYPLDRKGLNPARDLQSIYALIRLFKKERPDLLFATTIKPVIYGSLAAAWAGVPRIYATITGLGYAFESDSFLKKAVNRLSSLLYRQALSRVSGIFFQNKDDLEVFRKSGIINAQSPVFLARGTGVDTQKFAPAPLSEKKNGKGLKFLLVGRLLEAKGLPEYAEAARLLHKKYPDASFQLLGPEEKGLGSVPVSQVLKWQNEGLIEYLGATDDVRPYLADAHVLVLPSWREGVPTAVMEAMSMGRAAIVTDVPGCRELVRDGVNGLLVPKSDSQALALAMEKLLQKPELLEQMGQKGRQIALEDFDAEKVASGILANMGLLNGAPL